MITFLKCSVCRKASNEKYKPFCSKRCADLDLGLWLGEGYRVPTEEVVTPPASTSDTAGDLDTE